MGAPKKRIVTDRFEIEGEAGAGGAATVYRAHDRRSGERVAIKVLRTVMDAGAERFLREAETLARLEHPGVVRYVAHGLTDDGDAFLAMEWLDGRDLRRHLLDEGLTIAETVALGADVADALAAVHARGVLHRDVKPSNIFLVGAGHQQPAWSSSSTSDWCGSRTCRARSPAPASPWARRGTWRRSRRGAIVRSARARTSSPSGACCSSASPGSRPSTATTWSRC